MALNPSSPSSSCSPLYYFLHVTACNIICSYRSQKTIMSEVVPGFFPSTCPPCKEVSARFFFCFSTKAKKIAANDSEAARRGLEQCKSELKAYSECMLKHKGAN